MKNGKVSKLFSIFLATAMFISMVYCIPVSAASSGAGGNYIFNRGNSGSVGYMGGTDLTAETKPGVTEFGSALALVPTKVQGSGWAKIPARVPYNFSFADTNGIAMYVKFPTDVNATNLTIRLINDAWSQWFQSPVNFAVTLVGKGADRQEITQQLPFGNMQGFEGYVFIPYTSLTDGAHSSNDPRDLLASTGWNIEISYYKWDAADINKEYFFDQIGYYSDIDSYIALSEEEHINAEYTVNGGSVSGVTVTGGADIQIADAPDATKLGDAIGATILNHEDKYSGDGWIQIPADVADTDFDFSATKGIAMYAKIPDSVQNSDFRVRIIRKDWADGSWWATNINRLFTFATLDGTVISESSLLQFEPFENMQGFEGFIFIPWESMDSNGATDKEAIDPSVLNGSDWQIEINFYDTDTARIGKTFYFDEIGFYNNIEKYIKNAADFSESGNGVFNSGAVNTVSYTDPCEISVTEVEGVTPFGKALNIKPTKIHSSGWVKIKADAASGFDFTAANGIAMYVKFSENMPSLPIIRLINAQWTSWSNVTVGGNISIYSDGLLRETAWTLENMQGFEGFVFIPFSSMDTANFRNDISLDRYNWNIEIGYWSDNEISTQIDYYFDEIGYYSDADIYRSMATGIVRSGNYIFNSGNSSNVSVTYGSDVKVETLKNRSVTGDMLSISPKKQLGGGWGHIPMTVTAPDASFDFKSVKGIAMYVNFPNVDCEQSFLDMRIINRSETLYAFNYAKIPLTLVAPDGTVTTATDMFAKAVTGFEGFVFIPLSAFGNMSVSVLNGTDWSLEIGYYAKTESSASATYCFDEIGFYSDINDYIELVKTSRINEYLDITDSGDNIYIRITDDFNIGGNIAGLLSLGTQDTSVLGTPDGDEIESDAEVTTGYTVGLLNEESYTVYTIVKYGDINGDFDVNISDLIRFKRYLSGSVELEGANAFACSAAGSASGADTSDLVQFRKYLLLK